MSKYKYSGINFLQISITFLGFFLFLNCSERNRNNPLDPESGDNCCPISLQAYANAIKIELSWPRPALQDLTGYVLYKSTYPDSGFHRIQAELPADKTSFIDFNVTQGVKYYYYITIMGEGVESQPSDIVSVTPGPGFVWIVDKWGYQIVKTTYDTENQILRIFTDWPPSDLAVSVDYNIAVATYTYGSEIVVYNLQNGKVLKIFSGINDAHIIRYSDQMQKFWIADSSGSLLRLDAQSLSLNMVDGSLKKPYDLFLDNDKIYLVDKESKTLVTYDENGQKIAQTGTIGDYTFHKPLYFRKYYNSSQFWLIDHYQNQDYILRGNFDNNEIIISDSLKEIADLEINQDDQSVWVASINKNLSGIVQLSANGTRQNELSGLYYPLDIAINKYDGTLLVCETGNGRVLHYNLNLEIIGMKEFLNFPLRVTVE